MPEITAEICHKILSQTAYDFHEDWRCKTTIDAFARAWLEHEKQVSAQQERIERLNSLLSAEKITSNNHTMNEAKLVWQEPFTE